jgi:hypothetical protein
MKNILTLLTLAFTLFFFACKKEDQVGNDIQPGGKLGLVTTDTITVIATTIPGDSFPSKGLPNNYLGLINDPIYGKTSYSLFSQFGLSSANTFTNAVADSVILYLPYRTESKYYGELATPQHFQVYEIAIPLPSTANSNIDESPLIDSTRVLSDIWITPRPTDSIQTNTRKINGIRIPLDNSYLGNKFIAGAANTNTSESWIAYFKGLYIKTIDQALTGNKGVALNFDLDKAKIAFYYHVGSVAQTPVEMSAFGVTHIEQVKHNYSGSRFSTNSGVKNSDTLFLLGHGGEKITVRFPYLGELKKLNPRGNITINKAELQFTQILENDQYYVEATSIDPYAIFSNDQTAAKIGSDPTVRSSSNVYAVGIGSHIQDAIYGRTEKGVVLKLSNDQNTAQRAMIKGGAQNIKLVLTLTKL